MSANRAQLPQDASAGVFAPAGGSARATGAAVRGRKPLNAECGTRNAEFSGSALLVPRSAFPGGAR